LKNKAVLIPPGGRIGILGGGQLGRMLALAAAELGLQCHIYCPDEDAPAAEVASRLTRAGYDDADALARFADSVDVVTYEFENVPAETAAILAAHAPVRPGAKALATAQDRFVEKNFIVSCGIQTAPFADVPDRAALDAALKTIGAPAILKTRRFGYDGKGQAKIADAADAATAWSDIGAQPAILEGFVPFEREVSVIVARGLDGKTAAYDPVENVHTNHILDRTYAPAALDANLADEAAPSPRRSSPNSTMSASWASRCSCCPQRAGARVLSSTRSRPAFTTPAIGRRMPASSASSNSTSGRSAAGRSARPRAIPTP
jgi:5-(carboxyamino)imidazole ribonucleotide synthase